MSWKTGIIDAVELAQSEGRIGTGEFTRREANKDGADKTCPLCMLGHAMRAALNDDEWDEWNEAGNQEWHDIEQTLGLGSRTTSEVAQENDGGRMNAALEMLRSKMPDEDPRIARREEEEHHKRTERELQAKQNASFTLTS